MVEYSDKLWTVVKTRRDWVLIRNNSPYEAHAHFKRRKGCYDLIKLFERQLIPHNEYFRIALERVTTEAERNQFSEQRAKPKYYNVNKTGTKGRK